MALTEESSELSATPGYRVWSSGSLPEAEQFGFWNETVQEIFGPVRVLRQGSGGFRMEVAQTRVGAMVISSVRAEAHSAERDQFMANQDTAGRAYINVPRLGVLSGHQYSRDIAPSIGVLGMIAGSAPATLRAEEEFTQYVIGLPAEFVIPRLADSAAAGIASGALPNLLAQITDYVFHHSTEFGPADAAQLTQQFVDLVVASFGPSTAQKSGRSALLLQAAMDYADATLGDAGLSTDVLAAHVNVSRRTLEKLFADRGTTVAHWILERRLERASEDLVAPECSLKSIEAIAQGRGFVDRTHFSRVFKARFGVSPAAFRRRGYPASFA